MMRMPAIVLAGSGKDALWPEGSQRTGLARWRGGLARSIDTAEQDERSEQHSCTEVEERYRQRAPRAERAAW